MSNSKKNSGFPPILEKREAIKRFIVENLRPYVDATGIRVPGLALVLRYTNPQEEELIRLAINKDNPNEFKKEIRRALADAQIQVTEEWTFECNATQIEISSDFEFQTDEFGFKILRKPDKIAKAKLTVLFGKVFKQKYILDPTKKTIFLIGRELKPQLANNTFRNNDIAIIDSEKSVSRNHAYIKFDNIQQKYSLYTEESSSGGINKTSLQKADGTKNPVIIPRAGLLIENNDQIMLNNSVIMLFTYI